MAGHIEIFNRIIPKKVKSIGSNQIQTDVYQYWSRIRAIQKSIPTKQPCEWPIKLIFFISIVSTRFWIQFEISEIDFSEGIYEDAVEELPYINDPKQLGFYFSRNTKTIFFVLIFFYLSYEGIQLFWESLKVIVNNLLWQLINYLSQGLLFQFYQLLQEQ